MTETAEQGDQPLIIEPGPNVANKAVGIVIDNPETFEVFTPATDTHTKRSWQPELKATQEEERNLEEEEGSFGKTSQFSELMKNSKRACWGHARKNGRNGNNSTQQKIYRKNKQRSSYGKGIHVYHYSKAWAETDKNEPLRTPGKYVEPLYKAKRVTSGDLEQTPGATHLRGILKVKTFYSHSHQAKMRSIIT